MGVTNLNKKQLGAGIYTIPDISHILGYSQSKVRRYINDYWDERLGRKLLNQTYSWSIGNNIKAVNFYTLIELFTCFYLQEQGVTSRQVLHSREAIAKDLNVPFPFASANLLTDGKKLWYEFEDCIVNADGSKQMNFVEIIRKFADKIDFSSEKIAERFWPSGKQSCIVVDPHHQFGQPIIDGTNINAEMIHSMIGSGEKMDTIGILYDITEKDIRDVIRFYNKVA